MQNTAIFIPSKIYKTIRWLAIITGTLFVTTVLKHKYFGVTHQETGSMLEFLLLAVTVISVITISLIKELFEDKANNNTKG